MLKDKGTKIGFDYAMKISSKFPYLSHLYSL